MEIIKLNDHFSHEKSKISEIICNSDECLWFFLNKVLISNIMYQSKKSRMYKYCIIIRGHTTVHVEHLNEYWILFFSIIPSSGNFDALDTCCEGRINYFFVCE